MIRDGDMIGTQESSETTPVELRWDNLKNKLHKVRVHFNLEYKINIHESKLLQISD